MSGIHLALHHVRTSANETLQYVVTTLSFTGPFFADLNLKG
ncbi:MAG: hypothetical protein P8M20_05710 [Planctomycetaceae bacterium]|nr:hypothetical protein [Planctomycetaceae bacterium]